MTEQDLVLKCYEDYEKGLPKYNKMQDYYDGKHDILSDYKTLAKRSNQKIVCNYVQKFADTEVSYCVGQPLSYSSKSNDGNIIDDIEYNLAHFDKKHEQKLLLDSEIYGESYELYYINADGEFCSRILNPSNAYALQDDDGIVELFLHMYKKMFDETQYIDVYAEDRITTYSLEDSILQEIESKENIFGRVAVGVCEIDNTIYDKIKTKNDSYNTILSDNVNIISDFRNSYLVFSGADVGEKEAEQIHELGIIVLPSDAKVSFLLQEVNDQYIQNMLTTLEEDMHKMANSIDFNEKLQSNLSGISLRSRLLSMELRIQLIGDSLINCVMSRLKYLFQYLKIKEDKEYSYKDVNVRYIPNIPSDITGLADAVSKLKGLFSDETLIGLFSFGDNPQTEIDKRKEELSNNIDLDMLRLEDGKDYSDLHKIENVDNE